ncbi:uncharacterized protein LOC143543995 isoform X1 [Bidens hawaiensis]|uniref:uncharacterized protein LOC143543995 isoform X1 n=1 Tax=Bidens hawaiensis TaxID=980011 RepID=UPI0040499FA6
MEAEKELETNSPPPVDPLASTTNEPESSLMEVTTESDNKTRKTIQITVNISGVESASLVSSDNNQIVVSGEGTNSDQLSFSIGIKIDCTAMTTTHVNNNTKDENNFNQDPINMSGGTTDMHNQLPDYGKPASRISSGGGGKSH